MTNLREVIAYRGWTITELYTPQRGTYYTVTDPDNVRVLMTYSTLDDAKAEVDASIAQDIEKRLQAHTARMMDLETKGQMVMF